MKILFYNLGYGRGINGSVSSYVKRGASIVYHRADSQRKVLNQVVELVQEQQPDIFAFAEIGLGSFRNQNISQHEYLTANLLRVSKDLSASKYGVSWLGSLPFHVGNGNGVISFTDATISKHYLTLGRKKLILAVQTPEATIFTLHLPLVQKHRAEQLRELVHLVNQCATDVIVCGDFNIFKGLEELREFQFATNLKLSSQRHKTFPSHKPRLELDTFLYRFSSPDIQPVHRVLPVSLSDHLPIILEW